MSHSVDIDHFTSLRHRPRQKKKILNEMIKLVFAAEDNLHKPFFRFIRMSAVGE